MLNTEQESIYTAVKNHDQLSATVKSAVLYLVGAMLGVAVLLFVFRTSLISLYTTDAAVLIIGAQILVAELFSTLFADLAAFFTSNFQAYGKGVQSTVMAVLRGLVFIPVLIVTNRLFHAGGLTWAMTIAELLTCSAGFAMWLLVRRGSAQTAQATQVAQVAQAADAQS